MLGPFVFGMTEPAGAQDDQFAVARRQTRFQQAMIGEDHPAFQEFRMPAECGEDIEDAAEGFDGRLEHLPHLTGPLIFGQGRQARRFGLTHGNTLFILDD